MANTPGRNFSSQVSHVQSGSAVSASNTSKATRQLEQRTNYLKEIVDAIEAGELIVRREQSVHPDVLEGSPVYWDATESRYDLALAAVEDDASSSSLVPTASSDCIGICLSKSNSTTGMIACVGSALFTSEQMDNMIDGDVVPGRYYLSAVNPGKLVKQRPPVTVAVAYVLGPSNACESSSWVFINPQMRDFLEDHVHYQFDLTPLPAGEHSMPLAGVAGHHVINNADADLPGWLPANHASFNGTAPTGAKFGYNFAAHPELAAVWPPIPASAAVLEMSKPFTDNANLLVFNGHHRVGDDYVKIDKYGIWWLTSCYNQVPWPTAIDTTPNSSSLSSVSASASSSSSVFEEEDCPIYDQPICIKLSFVKMTFATDKSVVTSLQPATDEPISFVNCDGEEANTGDLFAKINVDALIADDNVRGGTALKQISGGKLLFEQGWVAEALIAGSDNVVLTGTHQELLDPTAAASDSNPTIHQGIVTVDVVLDPTERELNPQIVKLGDALEREYSGIMYLGFPTGRDSGIRMRFNIPPGGLPTNPKLKIRALVFGRAAGPFSEMTMGYYRVVRPTDGVPTAISSGDTAITFDVVTPSDDYDGLGTDLPLDNVIEVESDEFTIAAGDTVFVDLSRASDATPLFQADIGLIRIGGVIVAG